MKILWKLWNRLLDITKLIIKGGTGGVGVLELNFWDWKNFKKLRIKEEGELSGTQEYT